MFFINVIYIIVADYIPTRYAIVTFVTIVKSIFKSARILYRSCVVIAKRLIYAAIVIG